MERLLALLGQDEEILYLELAHLSYKDMTAFCMFNIHLNIFIWWLLHKIKPK